MRISMMTGAAANVTDRDQGPITCTENVNTHYDFSA